MIRILDGFAEAEIEVKKSRFLAAVKNCRSEEEAKEFLLSVRKKHYDARHNCSSYRIGTGVSISERQSDDGEPQGTAGKPMLDILRGAELTDVCAVVTRYFGGTLLGTGGLVRAYSDALKEALSGAAIYALEKGVRVAVSCDYQTANRIRNLAQRTGIYPEKEEYSENCVFVYLMPPDAFSGFAASVRELSAGSAAASVREEVLYYGSEKPVVYSVTKTVPTR